MFPGAVEIGGDSQDVMEAYYIDTLQELKSDLDHLNILDHPIQIQNICRKIKVIKNKLNAINSQRT